MGAFGGVLVVLFITLLAGGIAYVGDRVGHVVGRKRLSLFGLRPRHTSTVFAIGTGMLIALAVTVFALIASTYVQTAFFRIGELNDRVNALTDEAAALDRHTHDENVVVNRGDLMYGSALILSPSQTGASRAAQLASFFDATIDYVNLAFGPRALGNRALRPNVAKSKDEVVKQKLHEVLVDIEPTLMKTPVIVLAVADRNLFPHDPIHFRLQGLADRRVYVANEEIAELPIRGKSINAQLAINQLASTVSLQAISRGLPFYFATPLSVTSPTQLRNIEARLADGGSYLLTARAATDIYPHLGGLPILFSIRRGTPGQ